jgi:hypothetical protein
MGAWLRIRVGEVDDIVRSLRSARSLRGLESSGAQWGKNTSGVGKVRCRGASASTRERNHPIVTRRQSSCLSKNGSALLREAMLSSMTLIFMLTQLPQPDARDRSGSSATAVSSRSSKCLAASAARPDDFSEQMETHSGSAALETKSFSRSLRWLWRNTQVSARETHRIADASATNARSAFTADTYSRATSSPAVASWRSVAILSVSACIP